MPPMSNKRQFAFSAGSVCAFIGLFVGIVGTAHAVWHGYSQPYDWMWFCIAVQSFVQLVVFWYLRQPDEPSA